MKHCFEGINMVKKRHKKVKNFIKRTVILEYIKSLLTEKADIQKRNLLLFVQKRNNVKQN